MIFQSANGGEHTKAGEGRFLEISHLLFGIARASVDSRWNSAIIELLQGMVGRLAADGWNGSFNCDADLSLTESPNRM